jgi:hypothetical protein
MISFKGFSKFIDSYLFKLQTVYARQLLLSLSITVIVAQYKNIFSCEKLCDVDNGKIFNNFIPHK